MNTRGSALLLGAAAWCCLRTFQRRWARARSPASLSIPPTSRPALSRRLRSGALASAATSQSFSAMATSSLLWASRSHSLRHSTTSIRRGGLTRLSAQAYTGPGSTCTGKASKTVQIAAGPSPTITSMFTLGFFFSSDATPGALIILQGENFGDLPGQVWIHLKDYQGNASDHLLLDTQKYWHDTFVAGIVPDITGVLDQQATVTVVAQCGAVGNAQTVNFTADRDVADLAQHTDLLECSIPPRSKRKRPMHGVGRLELA
jgi:hypothetical protein